MVNASFWIYQEFLKQIVHPFQIQPKWAETLGCTTLVMISTEKAFVGYVES